MARESASADRWARISLLAVAIVLLAGAAQATPIIDFGADLEAARAPDVNHSSESVAVGTSVAVAAQTSHEMKPRDSVVGAISICNLSGPCVRTLKVPEPRSLVLVGLSLLSMAGLIRRQFALGRGSC
jgi:hypothetical protein